jgi:hypothetical protein
MCERSISLSCSFVYVYTDKYIESLLAKAKSYTGKFQKEKNNKKKKNKKKNKKKDKSEKVPEWVCIREDVLGTEGTRYYLNEELPQEVLEDLHTK